jgi:hypothetical protein
MKINGQKVLIVYSSVLSTIFGAMLLTGAKLPQSQSFDEIQVHRIDVVEPDGTLRMVISDHASLPGVISKGEERPPHDRPGAGMLFYNDEGSENGGLVFGGRRNDNGEVVDSGGSLSFDKYGQGGQVVQLAGVDDKTDRFAGLAVRDRNRRIWVGRTADGTASVSLMGADGKKHIQMQVTADGTPSLTFFDSSGNVLKELVPKSGLQ